MELITGVGTTDHIDSQDDADFQKAITGPDNYVLNIGRKMEAELLPNNVVRVHDGSLIHQGRHVIIPEGESEEVIIEYGTQGEKRIDLIVSVYSKDTTSGIETEFLKSINGTPSVDSPAIPSHIDGNIRAGDIYSEFPLYKVTLDGINIVSIDPLYEVLTSMAELKTMTDELNRKLPELVIASNPTISYTPDRNCNVLVTYESCGWGFGGTTWQIEIAGSASSGDSPTRTNNKRGVFDGTDGIYKDVSTSAYFTGLRAGVTYTFSKETYAGSGGKEANPFMKLLAV